MTDMMANNNFVTEKSKLITLKQESGKFQASISRFIKSGKELARSLGFLHMFSYIVGILFGSGVFISPSFVAKQTTSMGMALVIWIGAGVICVFGALCFCELAAAIKKSGGEYIFIKETYGDAAAFLTLWAQTLVVTPSALSVLAVTIAEYLLGPFYDTTSSSGIWLVKLIALLFLFIATIINSLSVSYIAKSQVFFTVIQVISVLFLVVLGIWKVSTGHTQNYVSIFDNFGSFDLGSLSIAFYNGLWAYDGWGLVCTITEELQNPERNLRLAIITGIPFVIVCYLLVNLSFMSVLTHHEIANSSTVATSFVEKILGKKVALLVPIAVVLSCFSALNASLLVCSRTLLSASREGHCPEPLSYIHADRRTPIPAVLLFCFLALIWILFLGAGTQGLLIYFSFAIWFTYGLAIFGVIVLRVRQPDLPRPFKVWIINPIFMTLVSLFLIIAPFLKNPLESTICLIGMLLAIPFYFLAIRKNSFAPACCIKLKKRFYNFILFRFKLVPCVYNNNKEPTFDITILTNDAKV